MGNKMRMNTYINPGIIIATPAAEKSLCSKFKKYDAVWYPPNDIGVFLGATKDNQFIYVFSYETFTLEKVLCFFVKKAKDHFKYD